MTEIVLRPKGALACARWRDRIAEHSRRPVCDASQKRVAEKLTLPFKSNLGRNDRPCRRWCRSNLRATAFLRKRLLDAEPENIEGGQDYQGHDRRDGYSSDHGICKCTPEHRRSDGYHAQGGSRGGQQDRPEPVQRSFDHGVPWTAPLDDFGI